jgi:hypothetical protein
VCWTVPLVRAFRIMPSGGLAGPGGYLETGHAGRRTGPVGSGQAGLSRAGTFEKHVLECTSDNRTQPLESIFPLRCIFKHGVDAVRPSGTTLDSGLLRCLVGLCKCTGLLVHGASSCSCNV